jgi:hypothetical protein
MRYVEATLPEKHNGGLQFTHELHHEVDETNRMVLRTKLKETLIQVFPNQEPRWRFMVNSASHFDPKRGIRLTNKMTIRFTEKNDALRFKMAWQD